FSTIPVPFFFYCVAAPPDLHSFPTRRSSDLEEAPTREEIDRAPGLVLLEFGTGGCGFCRAAAPRVSSRLREHPQVRHLKVEDGPDRKSTRLNSCHDQISYAVFCLKKKKNVNRRIRPVIREVLLSSLDRCVRRLPLTCSILPIEISLQYSPVLESNHPAILIKETHD